MPNKIKAVDYLSQFADIGYDANTKGVTATVGGKTYNLGNKGLTLGEDNHYYAENQGMLDALLVNGTGLKPVRDNVNLAGGTVDWANNQLIANGRAYNTGNMLNLNGTLYATDDFVGQLQAQTKPFANPYQRATDNTLEKLMSPDKFRFDPDSDSALKAARKSAMSSVAEEMNSRGILDSTITTETQQRVAQDLTAQYEQMAYNRYLNERNYQLSVLSALQGMSAQELNTWQANKTQEYNNLNATLTQKQTLIAEEQAAIERAYKKVELVGYADNETAAVLGVAPGTQAPAVRNAYLEQKLYLERQAEATEQERQTLRIKSEIDMNAWKEQFAITQEAAAQKGSSGGGRGGGGGGGPAAAKDPVAAAINTYIAEQGLAGISEMTFVEIISIIDEVISDPAARQTYYDKYGVSGAVTNETGDDYTTPVWQPRTQTYGKLPWMK